MQYLKNWELSDAPVLAKILSEEITQNLRDGIPNPYTISDGEEYIGRVLNSPPSSQYCWAIVHEGIVIGSIGLFRQSNIHFRTAELGYYIGIEHWGKGIMTAAVTEACNYIFKNTNIIRIYAEPFAYNIASCRVLEKSGFILEGILRKNAVKNDKIIDMKLYSLVSE